MLKDEGQAMKVKTNRIGCFFVMKQGRIFAKIKKGWGRGRADSNKTNKKEGQEYIKSAYNQSKEYEYKLLNQYNT